jgi:FKBP-type peptidyl-prolyl cis-trans isomerase
MTKPLLKYYCFIQSAIIILIAFSCSNNKTSNEFSTTKEGLEFKLLRIGEENKKAKEGDYLRISAEYYTENDSLFWKSANQMPLGYFLKVANEKSGNFTDHLMELSQGDSVEFKIRTGVFFPKTFQSEVPVFCAENKFIKARLKVIMVHSKDEYELIVKEKEAEIKRIMEEENRLIDIYVSQNMKEPIQLGNDFYMEWVNTTEEIYPQQGDRVWINYKGYFLNGTLIDYTKDGKVFEYRVGEQFQLIPGLETAILKMKKGETAKIVLPSRLAFGDKGSSNGLIPAYTPLMYELNIENIISNKK